MRHRCGTVAVERAHPALPRAPGVLLHGRVAQAGTRRQVIRRRGGARVRHCVRQTTARVFDDLRAGGGVRFTRLAHAGANEALEILVLRHDHDSFEYTTGLSPAALVVTQRMTRRIRECAPLCLAADPGWGGVSRGWAWIAAGGHNAARRGRGQDRALEQSGNRAPGRVAVFAVRRSEVRRQMLLLEPYLSPIRREQQHETGKRVHLARDHRGAHVHA